MKAYRKFYIQLTSGEQWEISELDYNHIDHRIGSGRTNGWYAQRGEMQESERHEWKIAFKDVAAVWADREKIEDKKIKPIDVDKFKMKDVGKPEIDESKSTCNHDWNDPQTWHHVTTIKNGNNRYHKMCNECGAKSPLIKKREVEVAQEAIGETLDTIPLVE